jgi:class 3 adenylate cyclase
MRSGATGPRMNRERVERRLAAILVADVAGYSPLMGADEEGTHERLQAHFTELVHPKIDGHRGRVVTNTGDGLLAQFASVIDAVRCAAEIQRGMIDRASAYGLRGDTVRAAAELAEARKLASDDRYSSIARLKAADISKNTRRSESNP